MSIPLLATKFYVPAGRTNRVYRHRLIEQLNEGLRSNGGFARKLTLLSAPAGFGKTTLLGEWIAGSECPVAWLSLEADDNTPARFWTYVIAALRTAEPDVGSVAQASLQSSPSLPIKSTLTSLINDLAALPRPICLVLDDYHTLSAIDVHESVAFFLDHLPARLHLAIATREDPPLALSRLRVRDQVVEIRADDLRFSEPEAAAFLNDLMGLALSADDVAALEARTEGWIAGLQLAALSMRSEPDRRGFVTAFAGSHRYLIDYLIDEVMAHQEPAVQAFLRRTAILTRFCAPLCDVATGRDDSRQVLSYLEQANLFLIPLDNERRWFRYHHLFAEFLQQRLLENEAEIIPELYRRVIAWLTQAGLHREALHYALRAREYEQAAGLIEVLAPETLARDNHMLVIQWIESLPPDVVRRRAYLCVYLAWACVIAGQMEAAGQWLTTAESICEQLEPPDSQVIRGHVAAHRAYVALLRGEYPDAIGLAQRALELLPDRETALRARAVTCLGSAYNYSGRLQEAKDAYGEAIEIAREIGGLSLALFSYCGLGEVLREQGRLTEAMAAYRQLLQFARDLTGKQDLPLTGYAQFEIGVIFREWHELDGAIEQIKKGVDLCREWQQGEALAVGLVELAETHRIRGEYAQTEAAIEDVRQMAATISPWAVGLVEGFAARLALSRGEIEAVARWAERSGLDDESREIGYERFSECLPLIRFHITVGNPRRALALTEPLVERDRALGRMGRVLDLLVLQVAARDAMGQPEQALQVLAEAVALAGPEKHVRPFVDAGPTLIPYLQKLPPAPHRDRLLAALGQVARPQPAAAHAETVLVEPLVEREIAILRLMAAGRSNREIGDELYLSVNTIRWYASQIYGKLGVKRRGEAVSLARKLGLL